MRWLKPAPSILCGIEHLPAFPPIRVCPLPAIALTLPSTLFHVFFDPPPGKSKAFRQAEDSLDRGATAGVSIYRKFAPFCDTGIRVVPTCHEQGVSRHKLALTQLQCMTAGA